MHYVSTEYMRNLFMTLDHNSPYFFKPFLDAFIPGVFSVFLRDRPFSFEFRTEGGKESFYLNLAPSIKMIGNYLELNSERDELIAIQYRSDL
jgi:hypothetical protein